MKKKKKWNTVGPTQHEGHTHYNPWFKPENFPQFSVQFGFGYCTTRKQAASFLITVMLCCRKSFKSHKTQNDYFMSLNRPKHVKVSENKTRAKAVLSSDLWLEKKTRPARVSVSRHPSTFPKKDVHIQPILYFFY